MIREILTRQVMISGRITDALTGSAPRATPIVTVVSDAGGKPLPGTSATARPDGTYAVHGDPSALPPASAVALRLEVTADGYAPAQRPVAFAAADLTRVTRTVIIHGEATKVLVIAAPARSRDVALSPLPVSLAGRVCRAEDPAAAIQGAQVSITAPAPLGPVPTDADGFFTLGPAPVAETVTLSITAPGRDPLAPVVRLDYRNSVNRGAFALEPA